MILLHEEHVIKFVENLQFYIFSTPLTFQMLFTLHLCVHILAIFIYSTVIGVTYIIVICIMKGLLFCGKFLFFEN